MDVFNTPIYLYDGKDDKINDEKINDDKINDDKINDSRLMMKRLMDNLKVDIRIIIEF